MTAAACARRARRVAALLAAAGLVAACTSPNPRWYTLARAGGLGSGTAPTVSVGPVTIPALVDRPQLVLDAGPNQVRIDEFSRWAAPLADDIGAALARTLSHRLDSAQVWVRTQAARPAAEVQVAVDLQRFEIAPGAMTRIDAVWTVRRDASVRTGRSMHQEVPAGPGIDAAVAAQARALARVGEDIARAIATP